MFLHHNSRMISGDPHDYGTVNTVGYVYPVTTTAQYENRIQVAPNLYQFEQVPPDAKVYDWPANPDQFRSDRLIGSANGAFATLAWDQLNARLGPVKKVNLIAIGFGREAPSMLAHQQEAKWQGGKKNDLVLCFGGGTSLTKPAWTYVFGWTDKAIVKRNLETLLLNTQLNDALIPAIEKEIVANYELKDFEEAFKHIEVTPPLKWYLWFIATLALTQAALHVVLVANEVTKEGTAPKAPRSRRGNPEAALALWRAASPTTYGLTSYGRRSRSRSAASDSSYLTESYLSPSSYSSDDQ